MRPDDIDLAGLLDGVIDLESLRQVPGHRLLAEDMFARFQRVNAHLRVPGIGWGDHHGVNVLSFQQFPVVNERVGLTDAGGLPGRVQVPLVHVAHRYLRDVVVLRELLLEVDMEHVLFARADVGNVDAVIGADDTAGSRRLVLPIHRRFQKAGHTHSRGNGGGFLDEGTAGFSSARSLVRCKIHKICSDVCSQQCADYSGMRRKINNCIQTIPEHEGPGPTGGAEHPSGNIRLRASPAGLGPQEVRVDLVASTVDISA